MSVTEQAVQQDYKNFASIYDEKWNLFHTKTREWILQDLHQTFKPNDEFHLCDLGCGTSAFLSQIKRTFPYSKLNGLDLSTDMIEIASQHLKDVKLTQANIEHINFKKTLEKQGIILSLFTLHHLSDPERFLQNLKSTASKDKIFYITDFARDTFLMNMSEIYWKACLSSHNRSFSSKELTNILETIGFEILEKKIFKANYFWCLQGYKLKAKL